MPPVGFIVGFRLPVAVSGARQLQGLARLDLGRASWQRDAAANDAKLAAVVKPWGALTIEQLATNRKQSRRPYAVSRQLRRLPRQRSARQPALGAPNLTDAVWQYGGDGDSILTSILDGRAGAMPAWGAALGTTA